MNIGRGVPPYGRTSLESKSGRENIIFSVKLHLYCKKDSCSISSFEGIWLSIVANLEIVKNQDKLRRPWHIKSFHVYSEKMISLDAKCIFQHISFVIKNKYTNLVAV